FGLRQNSLSRNHFAAPFLVVVFDPALRAFFASAFFGLPVVAEPWLLGTAPVVVASPSVAALAGRPGLRSATSVKSSALMIKALPTFVAGSAPLSISCKTRCRVMPSLSPVSVVDKNAVSVFIIRHYA
ncbi:MAG TPA: hypothetical protein PK012_26995, partial [Blastocatellia bacterium]|nr:hypothetical protein [Blastocatellia bacterium]